MSKTFDHDLAPYFVIQQKLAQVLVCHQIYLVVFFPYCIEIFRKSVALKQQFVKEVKTRHVRTNANITELVNWGYTFETKCLVQRNNKTKQKYTLDLIFYLQSTMYSVAVVFFQRKEEVQGVCGGASASWI